MNENDVEFNGFLTVEHCYIYRNKKMPQIFPIDNNPLAMSRIVYIKCRGVNKVEVSLLIVKLAWRGGPTQTPLRVVFMINLRGKAACILNMNFRFFARKHNYFIGFLKRNIMKRPAIRRNNSRQLKSFLF